MHPTLSDLRNSEQFAGEASEQMLNKRTRNNKASCTDTGSLGSCPSKVATGDLMSCEKAAQKREALATEEAGMVDASRDIMMLLRDMRGDI